LIDQNGTVHPKIATAEALRMAVAADLDLVEVNPTAEPPVCKIMDFGQFQYQQSRAAQESKSKSKKTETKGLRLSFKIGSGDILTRKKQAEKFLGKGNRVRIEMMLRGRERQHTGLAIQKVKDFIADIEPAVKIEQPVAKKGNTISAIINK
jgi:translation initiation factor IF-3